MVQYTHSSNGMKMNREERLVGGRRNVMNILLFLQNHPCVSCGESDPIVLQFDHINPRTKLFNVQDRAAKGDPWEQIKNEMNKCQVLCANCHTRKHHDANSLKRQLMREIKSRALVG